MLFAAVLLLGFYIGGWFYVSAQVQSAFDGALANLNRDGVIAQCANRQVGGFPFSISLNCDSLTYEDGGKQTNASTGALRSLANIGDPMLAEVEIDAPLRFQVPSMVPMWLDWARLEGDVRFGLPMPKRVYVDGEALAGQSDPEDESKPVKLFSLASFNARLAPDGPDLGGTGEFSGLQLTPEATGGRELPLLEGHGDVTVKNGLAMITQRANSFRGQAAEIKALSLTSGAGGVSLSGPISVDGDGLIDAKLQVAINDPKALSATLQKAVPEHAADIKSGLNGVAMLGKEVKLPLNIAKGRAWLGPIPLGDVPRLD